MNYLGDGESSLGLGMKAGFSEEGHERPSEREKQRQGPRSLSESPK